MLYHVLNIFIKRSIHMPKSHWIITVISLTSFMGCRSNKPAPLPPPATPYTAERLQAEFQQIDPSARVGLVDAVTKSDQLVAVSHLDPAGFHRGESISFMDSNKNLIAEGTVVRTVDDLLIVHYADESRPLRKGDLAVKVKM
jgi:hypothetical protein